jgi:predicted kinase
METVILIGIQGSGKSTFYKERLFDTHVRISLDLLKTRSREQEFLRACLRTGQKFAVDNTNARAAERARYIVPAKHTGFRVVGYFFEPVLRDAIRRNKLRLGRAAIPVAGIVSTLKRLERPTLQEGFDELYLVTLGENDQFVIAPYAAPEAGQRTAPARA